MKINKLKIQGWLLAGVSFVVLFLPFSTNAQTSVNGITNYAETPTVTLEVPIGETVQVAGIAEYIQIFYKFAVAAVAIIAAVMIMYAGITWLSAAGNSSKIGEAKERIWAALAGLVIAMLSYAILQTINPALVNPANPQIPVPYLEDGASLGEGGVITSPSNPGACTSSSQSCLGGNYSYIAAKNETEMLTHLVTLTFNDGLGHTANVRVHEDAASAFRGVFSIIQINNINYAATGSSLQYPIDFGYTATYNWRENRNNPACLSNHSFGFAIDVNHNKNPNCPSSQPCYVSERNLTSNICATYTASNGGITTCNYPDWLITAFTGNAFSWGGNWQSLKDYMHFEWTGHGCGV